MSKQTRVSHAIYGILPLDIEGFDSLAELALDMRRSWSHPTDEGCRQLDPEIQFCLYDLDPRAVRVELYADGVMGSAPVRQEMERLRQLAGAPGGYGYSAAVSAARPATDYTARVIPPCDGVAIPLEDARILWQG